MGDSGKNNKGQAIRQIVLVAIMLLFLGGFLLDKFVLWPSHEAKIKEIVEKVTLKLSSENRKQVHDIIGRAPNSVFTHNGIEVEQYRFARGIPGFKRQMLDIAYAGDTIAFFRHDEAIDAAYIDQQRDVAVIDKAMPAAELGQGQVMGPRGLVPPKEKAEDNTDSDPEEGDSDSEDGSSSN